MKLIDKDALVAEIEKRLHANGAFDEVGDEAWAEDAGMCNAYKASLSFLDTLDTLEVKEVDLNLIIGWFDHIAQMANDRLTLNGERMTDGQTLIEIKCLAKDSSEFIKKWYQKGE